ncbi:DUF1080 domain-containing protein [Humisphaera borealis]|uniref:DUF1080 domain-containing protein n=2 Tax=Humisphaera borealis TaxID=2807512 RepID=A0A7M2X3Y2_9BACT|nr:DUF1080 domain-containing protein [Humisphaera borealis]
MVLLASVTLTFAARAQGVLPVGADGKPLNLDFETGTLKDWTAEGAAFEGQPIKGDTVSARGRGMIPGQQGDFWIGGYEKSLSDKPVGTLTSAPFKVTHRWATFMVAGGKTAKTRVELVTADDNKAFFQASGVEHERLWPVLVDLEKLQGKSIRIRIVDEATGAWGHVNFDDFRLHAEKPELKPRPGGAAVATSPGGKPLPPDTLKYAGLSPEDAVKAMTLPPGFKAQVFTAEPDLINPIAFTIDARGRIWVVQSFTYPIRAPEGEGKDSILIFEDTDGDGKADKRTVFAEKLNLVSGIEVGFGGVWVGAAPYLMFIPYKDDADGTTKQAGEPKILLDGWGYQDTHETLNSFMWGPDGWLYGCHGVFTNSFVGKPGTPQDQRVHINAGIWRYHPTKHVFERFAEGTSNPWGLDFDEHGQIFIEACVIPHLWHVIQGARYQRQAGQHDNPYTFDDIKQIGDHVHYLGATPHSGNGKSDSAGGGHAHSGLMVYLGDNWPDEYRGKIFMNNIHGARINMDIPEPKGSGYVGRHGKDFLLANDRASQIIAMRYGPDGSVYFADWYDLQQCHTRNPKDHDRTTGRIYKVSYGDVKPVKVDLEKLSDLELVKLQEHKNEWYVRTARRVLHERATKLTATDWKALQDHLIDLFEGGASKGRESLVLRYLWTLYAILPEPRVMANPKDDAVFVATNVRLWGDRLKLGEHSLNQLAEIAKRTDSPLVRLSLSSTVGRLPIEVRWQIVGELLSHSEDATDHNLPLMYWYALEPLLDNDASRALDLAASTKIPNILNFSARKLAMIGGEKNLDLLAARLADDKLAGGRLDILRGMTTGLKGRRGIAAPKDWDKVAASLVGAHGGVPAGGATSADIAEQVRALSVIFGSKTAMADMRKVMLDRAAKPADRLAALDALVTAKDADLAPNLFLLLDDPAVRAAAIRALANYDDAKTPAAILGKYAELPPAEKKDALATLASRPSYAVLLLEAVDKQVPRGDFTADLLRQLRTMSGNKGKGNEVADLLNRYWARVNETDKDKLAKIAKYKKLIGEAASDRVDPSRGRQLFVTTCAGCHTLFGEGGKVGPDITGSDRANIDYLLHNVVDPNAVIPVDYQAWQLDTKDDRTIIGILKQKDAQTVTLQTATEIVTVNQADVAKLKPSPLSMMPEGALDALSETDVRNLIAYLRSPKQVPLQAAPDAGAKGKTPADLPAIPLLGGGDLPAGQIFNGKDLTGWEWQMDGLWSVQNGEIVGKTETGLKKNQFITTRQTFKDFRLIVKMKLVPDAANSGIQIRSVRIPGSHEMRGCQCDAGKGWWGKLYEESARGLLFPKKGEEFDATPFLKLEDWNTYEVLAVGGKIRTAINGKPCTVLDDDTIAKEGLIGLQVHSGGPTEVRWKEFELEIDPKFELKTVK